MIPEVDAVADKISCSTELVCNKLNVAMLIIEYF